jgi:hypothetical protein
MPIETEVQSETTGAAMGCGPKDHHSRGARRGSLRDWCERHVAWIAEVDVDEAAFWKRVFKDRVAAKYWREWCAEQDEVAGPKFTLDGTMLDA